MVDIRIGNGYDIHRLVLGRPLILGGIHIPHRLGLLGHSDADVLSHFLLLIIFLLKFITFHLLILSGQTLIA